MREKQKVVYIGSSISDLPDHKSQVLDACLRQDMFPLLADYALPNDSRKIEHLFKLIDDSDVYLGVFAQKYGEIPKGYSISLYEMEYNRAKEKRIPLLLFIADEEHLFKAAQIDNDEGRYKLRRLLLKLKTEHTCNFFSSPEDLRAYVINSLSMFRISDLTDFHFVSEIPSPPNPYIAHPYSLLQTQEVIGRQSEINLLTEWVANPSSVFYPSSILTIVAIGGMGKSALTWKWFNDIAPNEMQRIKGRMWWSFYESDATFENFIIRALAYVKNLTKDKVQQIPIPQREDELLSILNQHPYLIVLDGIERILIAYSRMDASKMHDDDLDEKANNYVSGASGIDIFSFRSFLQRHYLRKSADPRAGVFLRKLAQTRTSRILISTRLYPAELQTETGEEIPGCKAVFLNGLNDDDALNLWRNFGVTGAKNDLVPLFNSFDNYPLLINSLAGEIANFRHSPKDFGKWRAKNPDFNPYNLPIKLRKTHILEYSMRGLNLNVRITLITIAAFRMPVSYHTLVSLLVGSDKTFQYEHQLDRALCELEDRGLLGWDKRSNRYDLHPVVRGITWHRLGIVGKKIIYRVLESYFKSLPLVQCHEVERIEDLTPAIELFNTLVGLELFDDAFSIYITYICEAITIRFCAILMNKELIEALFINGITDPPKLKNLEGQIYAMHILSHCYYLNGQASIAESIIVKTKEFAKQNDFQFDIAKARNRIAWLCFRSLYFSELECKKSLVVFQDTDQIAWTTDSLFLLADLCFLMGRYDEAKKVTNYALELCNRMAERFFYIKGAQLETYFQLKDNYRSGELVSAFHQASIYSLLSRMAIFKEEYDKAMAFANKAINKAIISKHKGVYIRACIAHGETSLALNKTNISKDKLSLALNESRKINNISLQIATLVGFAKAHEKLKNYKTAMNYLKEIWWLDEEVAHPIIWVESLIIKSRIELVMGNIEEAMDAAIKAFKISWFDGPPFSFQKGLNVSRLLLKEMGIEEPKVLKPFDKSSYEPMPILNI